MKGVGAGFRQRRHLAALEQRIASSARRGMPYLDFGQRRPAEEPFAVSASGSDRRGGLR